MKKTRNLFIRGSTLCLIVFVMVLVLMAPNNVLAAQTIALEKLQVNFTGTNDLAYASMDLLTPAECVFRINDAQELTTTNLKDFAEIKGTNTKHFLQAAAAMYKNPEQANYFARNYITGNIGNAGHNKIFATVNTDLVNMRTGLTRNVAIAANTEATGYHPKIC